jgi:hypothetical protein
MILARQNLSTKKNLYQYHFFDHKTHRLALDRTRNSAVKGRGLTTRAMSRPRGLNKIMSYRAANALRLGYKNQQLTLL